MAKKKEEIRIINVKNPKEGKFYEFVWAKMTTYHGECVGINQNLTKTYGVKWYTFHVPASNNDTRRMGRPYWIYSCSIFDIIKEISGITKSKYDV